MAMEEVAMADCFHLVPRLPLRAEPQTLQPGADDLHTSSSPGFTPLSRTPGTDTHTPRSPPPYPLAQLLLQQQRQQPSSPPGLAVYALQSKVKALSACRTAGREALRSGLDKKGCPALVGLISSSSDEDSAPYGSNISAAELDVQMDGESLTGLDLSLLAFPRSLGEGSSLENLSDASCSTSSTTSQVESSTASPRPWVSQRPETLLLYNKAPRSAADSPNPGTQGTLQKRRETAQGLVCSELQRPDSLESHQRRFGRSNMELQGLAGCLWRDESLESMDSNGSSLSLAERVEMNRDILKQMLNGGPRNSNLTNGCNREGREGQTQGKDRGIVTLNDSDWDSGISLQDSEHSQRVFVSGEDLSLGPCHEQAKQLLERARMKARSFPLKADHTILPVQRDNPEPVSRPGARPLRQAPLAGKEGVAAPLSGNLSDSSSSDSACGGPRQRRRPGQSPTRVRFQDETEKEAEIRYLERQRRRAGERAQGPLVSKPNLSAYVNGRKEAEQHTGASNRVLIESGCFPDTHSLWLQRPRRAPDSLVHSAGGGHYKTLLLQDKANRQCNSCGMILDGAVPILNPYPNPSPPLQIIPVNGECEGKVVAPYWVPPSKPSLTLCTEPIKETYIGTISPEADRKATRLAEEMTDSGDGDRGGAESGGRHVSTMRVKRRTKRAELTGVNGYMVPVPPDGIKPRCAVADTPGTVEMPPNPYASELTGLPTQPLILLPSMEEALYNPLVLAPPKSALSSSPLAMKLALKSRANGRLNSQQVVKLMPSLPLHRLSHPGGSLVEQGRDAAFNPQEEHCAVGMLNEMDPSTEGRGQAPSSRTPCLKYAPSPTWSTGAMMNEPAPEAAVDQSQTGVGAATINSPPPYKCGGDGRVRGPMRVERQRDDSPSPDLLVGTDSNSREGRSRLSLRRIFSAMGLNGTGKGLGKGRSSSLDHLSSKSRSGPGLASPNLNKAPAPAASGQLKKTPSLQSLRMGSPFLQMRKSSSVQSLQSAKKKGDRSNSYTPCPQPSLALRGLQRALSVEDVGCPSGVRSVGRVAQAFPDGTLLLELSRPPNGPYGFLISRGRGRTDSGVYVEEMSDNSTEKLYAGLLGVGDEILEVNGEKVAGLSLDAVTRLMTQDSTASIRVLRQRRLPPR